MKTLVLAGRLIDGTGAPARDGAGVVFEDEAIAYVGSERGARTACPRPDEEIDARDGAVVPGLIDGHCHVVGAWEEMDPHRPGYRERLVLWGAGAAQAALAAGVTTLGDCGAPDDSSLLLRDAIASGHLTGPRLVVCGPSLTTTAGHGDYLGIAALADNADELRRQVRRWVRAGIDFVKVMATGGSADPPSNRRRAQYTVEELTPAVADAHRLRRRVVAHCNATEGIRHSVEAGVDVIAHCNWLGCEEGVVEYDDAVARRMGKQGTMVDLNGGGLIQLVPGEGRVQGWHDAGLPARRWDMIEHMRRAHGVRVYLTTDALGPKIAGFPAVLTRFAREADVGPTDVLQMATQLPAIGIGVGERVGTLEVGKLADLVVLAGDPSADPSAFGRARLVVKGGRVVARDGRLAPG
ncbi:MAG TPA: amidohydrolase family protein [Chloroflexota bacterium]|jgi:imidazolonepropionase-like amidohydrolase